MTMPAPAALVLLSLTFLALGMLISSLLRRNEQRLIDREWDGIDREWISLNDYATQLQSDRTADNKR